MAQKPVKQHVVSFRVPEEMADRVKKMLGAQRVIGIKSVNQYFRKASCDFFNGKTTYKDPADAFIDLNVN